MLENDKYIGLVRLLSVVENQEHYVPENNHPAIILKEKFEAVQTEKKKKNNVVKTEDGVKRKSSKYSSKIIKEK